MTSSRRRSEIRLRTIALYSPEGKRRSFLNATRAYLKELFPSLEIRVLADVFRRVSEDKLDQVAKKLVSSRVKDPSSVEQCFEVLPAEVDYEIRSMRGRARVGGVVYNGNKLQELFMSALLPKQSLSCASVVFTDRLTSTYSRDDMCHHLRMMTCGFPSIVSIPGIVEAPARPREFYLLKQKMVQDGAGDYQIEQLKGLLNEQFIDYGDKNEAEAMKGLALQAVMYHLTLDPFCKNRDCRLFNSHWQTELIRSQVTSGRLCDKHTALIEELAMKPVLRW